MYDNVAISFSSLFSGFRCLGLDNADCCTCTTNCIISVLYLFVILDVVRQTLLAICMSVVTYYCCCTYHHFSIPNPISNPHMGNYRTFSRVYCEDN